MSDRHTPGPWFWEGGGISGYTGKLWGSGGKKVFDSCAFENMWFSQHGPEDNANARLIAAAPDLLAALDHVIHVIEKSENWWIDCPDRGGLDAELIRAAIAKARGADFAPRPDDVGQSDG